MPLQISSVYAFSHALNYYQNIMAALRRLEKTADRSLIIANLIHYAKVDGEMNKV